MKIFSMTTVNLSCRNLLQAVHIQIRSFGLLIDIVKLPVVLTAATFLGLLKVNKIVDQNETAAGSKLFACNLKISVVYCSDSFTILGLWVLGLAVSHINESNCKLMSP